MKQIAELSTDCNKQVWNWFLFFFLAAQQTLNRKRVNDEMETRKKREPEFCYSICEVYLICAIRLFGS